MFHVLLRFDLVWLEGAYDPDKNRNNPASAEKFKEISNAYSVLGDKDNRSRYDMERKMGNGPIDLNDLFGSIFRKLVPY